MACISQYGLHVEAIIFPGGLQEKKTGRSGGEGDRKTIDSLKKGVPAADVSACGKMQRLTINFPTQLASGTGSSSSLPKKISSQLGKRALGQSQLQELQSTTQRSHTSEHNPHLLALHFTREKRNNLFQNPSYFGLIMDDFNERHLTAKFYTITQRAAVKLQSTNLGHMVLLSEMETPPNFSYKKEFNTPVLPADHSFADSISLLPQNIGLSQGEEQHVLSSSKKLTWAGKGVEATKPAAVARLSVKWEPFLGAKSHASPVL
ncbi:hypothetical protein Anapl_09366 [Anas platyrhynchos]|uniref:Uncharacterized protein n=1 Tax=Anas platyrhynchos TaxID=8839 RepID=R0JXG6_ANAPL|nr:hypothetical protein Anapl_09366 [Anas platyrhynchos]